MAALLSLVPLIINLTIRRFVQRVRLVVDIFFFFLYFYFDFFCVLY